MKPKPKPKPNLEFIMSNTIETTANVIETVKPARGTKVKDRMAARKRFSFGPVWTNAVMAGKVTDVAKLVAHAKALKLGSTSDLQRLKFDTLLNKVSTALANGAVIVKPAKPVAKKRVASSAAKKAA
jgi:hypothetical protein